MLQDHVPHTAPSIADLIADDPDLTDEFDRVDHVADVHAAAEAIVTHLTKTARLDLLVAPLARALATHRQHRNTIRGMEQAVIAEAEAAAETAAHPAPTPAAAAPKGRRRRSRPRRNVVPSLRSLLSESFFTGRRWVRYDDATTADFRASVAFLRTQIDGIQRTVTFREMCAAAIDAHPGARTLRDVPTEVLVDVLAARS